MSASIGGMTGHELDAELQAALDAALEKQVREMCRWNAQIMRSQSPQALAWSEYGNVGLKASVDDPFETGMYPC